ncbi:MAG: hypothetical protein Q9212_004041 [Teloschistes hypoglaucus]
MEIIFYPNAYRPSGVMKSALGDPSHVLRLQMLSQLQSRSEQGLWLRVSANGFPAKSTARSWAKRRILVAFKEELKIKGFGPDGMSLAGGNQDVRGTMNVYVKQAAVTAEWRSVKAEVGKVLEAVVNMSGTTRNQEPWRRKPIGPGHWQPRQPRLARRHLQSWEAGRVWAISKTFTFVKAG